MENLIFCQGLSVVCPWAQLCRQGGDLRFQPPVDPILAAENEIGPNEPVLAGWGQFRFVETAGSQSIMRRGG